MLRDDLEAHNLILQDFKVHIIALKKRYIAHIENPQTAMDELKWVNEELEQLSTWYMELNNNMLELDIQESSKVLADLKTTIVTTIEQIESTYNTDLTTIKEQYNLALTNLENNATQKFQEIDTTVNNKMQSVDDTLNTKLNEFNTEKNTKFNEVDSALEQKANEFDTAINNSKSDINDFMKDFTSETAQDVTFNLVDAEGNITTQTIPNLAKTKLDIKKNTVDMEDYEEGTFNPSFTSGININIIEAKYTKTGKFVEIYIHGSILNVGTDDALYLEGLPFISDNYSSSVVDFGFIKSNFAYSRVLKDLNKMDFLTPNVDGSYRSVIKGSDVGTSYFIINASYKVK
jgi:hypothetical protein